MLKPREVIVDVGTIMKIILEREFVIGIMKEFHIEIGVELLKEIQIVVINVEKDLEIEGKNGKGL